MEGHGERGARGDGRGDAVLREVRRSLPLPLPHRRAQRPVDDGRDGDRDMIRRVIAVAALLVALATALVLATASAQTTWAVKAKDPPDAPTNVWDPGLPDVIEAQPGDTMSFEFDEARTVHNLFLALPDGEEL